MTHADKRRRDSSRSTENWMTLSEHLDITSFKIQKDKEDILKEWSLIKAEDIPEDELNIFVQFAIVPISKGALRGIILNDPFKRVPDWMIQKYTNEVFVLSKSQCSKIVEKDYSKKSGSLHFHHETKSIDAIKEILSKMERNKVADVTISWRRENVCISYAISGKNVKDMEDIIDIEFAEKLRNSLISMSYENQSEKLVDGKFSLHILGESKEYRLSVIETIAGYSIVIRSYQKFNAEMTLDDLGYLEKPKKIIESIVENNSYGIFLITGPTGSGKTTTIYTIINEAFKKHNLKIKTAEDPVEIEISGIDQCQINKKGEEKHQITYINLLSSFMRQRPDIIVIGEIRDKNVAMSAVEAALTGHVVITTLHTNNIASTFTRLTNNMGITEDRIEDSFSGILSQRLVDKLCSCKVKDGEGYKANEKGCKLCEEEPTLGFLGQIPAVEIASIQKIEKNYLPENYSEYYSYKDSAEDLYKSGFIDRKTKKVLESL